MKEWKNEEIMDLILSEFIIVDCNNKFMKGVFEVKIDINVFAILATIINFSILIAIIILLYKAMKGIKNFINRNKELDRKVDIILSKLEHRN